MRRALLSQVTGSSFILSVILFGACGGSATPDATSPYLGDARTPRAETVALYDETKILDFKLTIADDQWAIFQQIHANPPPQSMRDTYTKVYVHCGFEALGVSFPDAACRPKGNPSSWADEKKPQFVIKFDHWDDNGRFLTLRTINLEYNAFSLAPVRDRLGMWVMRQLGIKAPRVNHVRAFRNGTELGLYMNIEEVDKEFLQWQFAKSTGNLYAQGFKLETNTKTPDLTRLTNLNALVDNEPLTGDHSEFFSAIDRLVDIPEVLAETAAEVVLPTGDNWSNGGTNYFYYDDPATGKFILLPWDLDTTMRADLGPATADLYTYLGPPTLQLAPNKMLQLLYQKPEWKRAFENNLIKVRDTVYSRLSAYSEQTCAQIRAAFVEDVNRDPTADDFDTDCAYLKKHIADRTAYIQMTLGR